MILLRKAKIFDSRSQNHLKILDILIDKGVIVNTAKNIKVSGKVKVIESNSLSVSPGWLDIGCFNGEPGYEYREDLESLCAAAAQGGYCGIAPFPSGNPTLDTKGQLKYLLSLANDKLVDIYPVATLTKKRKGAEISEVIDLHYGGAIAFSDGQDDNLDGAQLLRSMLYLKSIDGITIYNACKNTGGHLHEGSISVQMGMEGLPEHLEEANINQAIRQSEYAHAKIIIHNASTTACLKEIKSSGNRDQLAVSVPFMNLIFEDNDVLEFDLNLKTSPPLRNNSKALSKAVSSGQINIISSNHTPLSLEEKDQPFGLSNFGASTIDTVFPALNTYSKGIALERLVHCLSIGPHQALKLACPRIEKEQEARITIFDPTLEISLDESHIKSKSKNNPFIGKSLKGGIIGIINGSRSTL